MLGAVEVGNGLRFGGESPADGVGQQTFVVAAGSQVPGPVSSTRRPLSVSVPQDGVDHGRQAEALCGRRVAARAFRNLEVAQAQEEGPQQPLLRSRPPVHVPGPEAASKQLNSARKLRKALRRGWLALSVFRGPTFRLPLGSRLLCAGSVAARASPGGGGAAPTSWSSSGICSTSWPPERPTS